MYSHVGTCTIGKYKIYMVLAFKELILGSKGQGTRCFLSQGLQE